MYREKMVHVLQIKMENYSNYYYYMQSLNNYQNYQAQLLQQQIETQSSSQPTSSRQSAESSTSGNNEVKQKSKRERWSHDQTKVRLIIMYADKFDELESSRCNQIWPSIVEAVSSHGREKTLKQCKVRIRNMKNAYKKCKDENKKSGNKSNKSPFYDDSFNEIKISLEIVILISKWQ